MISKINKNQDRQKRHLRIRNKVSGTAEQPRLNVYRSLNNIYAQIIDDVAQKTIVACSTKEKAIISLIEGKNKVDAAKIVGEELAKRAIAKGVKNVVFDRGGYIYTGRVSALADGARNGGLQF